MTDETEDDDKPSLVLSGEGLSMASQLYTMLFNISNSTTWSVDDIFFDPEDEEGSNYHFYLLGQLLEDMNFSLGLDECTDENCPIHSNKETTSYIKDTDDSTNVLPFKKK